MRTLLVVGLWAIVGCGDAASGTVTESAPLPAPAGEDAGDAQLPEGPDPLLDAGVGESAACLPSPPVTGPVSDDCFAFDSCSYCGVPSGLQYWCKGDGGERPSLSGCVADPLAFGGYAGSCCPGPATCTALSEDDAYCASQCTKLADGSTKCLPGHGWSCPSGAKATAPGCLPSGTTYNTLTGAPEVPSGVGAALFPAERTGLYCCPS